MMVVAQFAGFLIILIALAIPLGRYISKVMDGERVFLSPLLAPVERGVYRLLALDPHEEMGWKKYAKSVLIVSALGVFVLMALLMAQGLLPLNPQHIAGMKWDLAFNTAVSFVTNTNWQAYSGESAVSYFSQMMGLAVQNFVSAAMGLSVLWALIRGLVRVQKKSLGSFWVDMTRSIIYILIPLSLVLALALVSQGVVQNFNPNKTAPLVETVTAPGAAAASATARRVIPQGPMASQIAIKQLGTNGGGYNGTNSAHPSENPTILSNLLELIAILLLPAALCFAFGRSVNDTRQGRVLFGAMLIVLVIAMGAVAYSEQSATPQLSQKGAVDVSAHTSAKNLEAQQAGGNMEGKEVRFGIASSSAWAVFTTAASSGSVNSMHDSYTPLGGMVLMLLMQLGEVIFGGVGSGLYGMLGFVIFTVFLAGLMVGRTPEFLGKKIEPREMKMATIVCLATPVAILVGSGIAALVPGIQASLHNTGAHGFSELLYAYTSAGANNGSAFAGLNANTLFFNLSLALCMLFARFLPIVAVLALAGGLVRKKRVAQNAGTLATTTTLFAVLLVIVILFVGALSFFPALSLGPVAEFMSNGVR